MADKIFKEETTIDEVQIEVTKFLTDLLSEELSQNVAEEARAQLRLADEYESVSDYIANVLKLYLRIGESDVSFADAQQAELLGLHDQIVAYYDSVDAGLENASEEYLDDIRSKSRDITNEIRELRDRHWNRLSDETVDPLISTSYMDVANGYRRMKDHLLNIGEAAIGGKSVSRARAAQASPSEP